MLKSAIISSLLFGASALAFAAPVAYQVDPTHTATVFSWNHLGFSHPSANFKDIRGVIHYDAQKPSNSSVNITIPVNSVNTNVPLLDSKIQDAEWFDVAKHPNITFKSTKVEPLDGKRLKVTGNLTFKGIAKPVVLVAKLNHMGVHPMVKKPAIGFDATTHFKRSDFGMTDLIPSVSDRIDIKITTEAIANGKVF